MASLWDHSDAVSLLAQYLGLENPELIDECLWLLNNHGKKGEDGETVQAFIRFFIKKKSGGKREILAPVEPLKGLLRTVSFELLSRCPLSRFAHGWRKNRSAITNANEHLELLEGLERAYGVNWDIQDCFPSTDLKKIRKVFQEVIGKDLRGEGVSEEIIERIIIILVQLTTFQYGRTDVPVLPMGSPTSPPLMNLVLRAFDLRVAKALKKLEQKYGPKFTYTRYGDDISITSPYPLPSDVFTLVPDLLLVFGYRANRKKTIKMMRGGSRPPITVTGFIVGKEGLLLSDEWLKETEMALILYLTLLNDPGDIEYQGLRGRLGLARKINGGDLPKRLENCLTGALNEQGAEVGVRALELLEGKPRDEESPSDPSDGYDWVAQAEEEQARYYAAQSKLIDETDLGETVEAWHESDFPDHQDTE